MENHKMMFIIGHFGWFAAGVAIYWMLAAMRVYILWYIQPRVLAHELKTTNPFAGSVPGFFRTFFMKTRLHKGVWMYYFRYNLWDWRLVVKSRDIEVVLGFLKALMLLLSPYLVIAAVWILLKTWIYTHFMYEHLQTTLGSIQVLLTGLKRWAPLKFLEEYEVWVVGACTVVGGLMVFAYSVEKDIEDHLERAESFRSGLSLTLVCLSIIGNISFFGADAGRAIGRKEAGLKDLDEEISGIHDNIYRKAGAQVLYNDLSTALLADYELEKGKLPYLNTSISDYDTAAIDPTIIGNLQMRLQQVITDFGQDGWQRAFSLGYDPSGPSAGPSYHAADFIKQSRQSQQQAKEPTDAAAGDAYFSDETLWTVAEGQRIENEIEAVVVPGEAKATFQYKLLKLLEQVIGAVYSSGFDAGTQGVLTKVGVPDGNRVLMKIAGIIYDEHYKPCFINNTMIFLTKMHKSGSKSAVPLSPCNAVLPDTRSTGTKLTAYFDKVRSYIKEAYELTAELKQRRKIEKEELLAAELAKSREDARLQREAQKSEAELIAQIVDLRKDIRKMVYSLGNGLDPNVDRARKRFSDELFKTTFGVAFETQRDLLKSIKKDLMGKTTLTEAATARNICTCIFN